MKLRPGTKYCQCAACGEYFTNPANFDLHRRGEYTARFCVPPGTITYKKGKHSGKARLRLNSRGYWTKAEGAYIPSAKDSISA